MSALPDYAPLAALPSRPALTHDERVLLQLLAAGLSDHAVARRTGVCTRTVGRRLARLQEKLGSRTRFGLGVEAARRGLV